jgi:hypothetical protein
MLSFMLKSYEGDIYNNMLVLVISGVFATFVGFRLIKTFNPTLALALGFFIITIPTLIIYPSMNKIN